MPLKLKPNIRAALNAFDALDLVQTLDKLACLTLRAQERFLVMKLENLLCAKPDEKDLSEP